MANGGIAGGFLESQESQADIASRLSQTRLREEEARRVQQEYDFGIQTRTGADRTLQLLSGAGGPPGPPLPAPQPGQPSQPAAQQPAARAQQPAVEPAATGSMVGAPGERIMGGPPAGPPPIGGPPAAAQPEGAPPQAAQPAQRQPPKGYLGPGGPLTMREVINAAVKANPGAPSGVIYGVVNNLVPLMKVEEQAAWHEATISQRREAAADRIAVAREREARLYEGQQEKLRQAAQKIAAAETEAERKQARFEMTNLIQQQNAETAAFRAQTARELGEGRLELGRTHEAGLAERAETREAGREKDRQVKLDIAAQTLGTRERIAEKQIAGRERVTERQIEGRLQVAELNAATRTAITESNQAFRQELTEFVEGRKDYRQGQSENFKRELARMHASEKRELTEYLEKGRMFRAGAAELGRTQRLREGLVARAQVAREQTAAKARIAAQALEARKEALRLGWERFGLSQDRVYGLDAAKAHDALAQKGITTEEIEQASNVINLGQVAKGGTPPQAAGFTGVVKQAFTRAAWNLADEKLKAQGITDTAQYRTRQANLVRAAGKTIDRYMGAGPQGDQVRFLSVAAGHLEVLEQLGAEWQALGGHVSILDAPVFNKVKAYIMENIAGYPEPTNVKLAAQILGTEIIKSLAVARAGTAQERAEMEKNFSTSASWDQMLGAVNTARKMLHEQREGMRNQFKNDAVRVLMSERDADKLFDSLLTEQARKEQMAKNKLDESWSGRSWVHFNPDALRSKGHKDADVPANARNERGDILPGYMFWWLPSFGR